MAAERNVFITAEGNVIPCCFNRKQIMGNLFYESLEDVLHNPQRKQLRSFLQQNNFEAGCLYCQQALTKKNYQAAYCRHYDLWAYSPISYPVFAEFELDMHCNLRCIMCPEEYHTSRAEHAIPPDFIEKIAPLLNSLRAAKFYGGEPFISKCYIKIWQYLIEHNPNCVIKVQTNGSRLDNSIKQLLEKGNFALSVSIDSLHPERYNTIRKGADFNETFANLEYLMAWAKRKKCKLNVAVCPMTINAGDLPEMIKFCHLQNLYINFNIVEEPKALSLKYESAARLQKIIEMLNAIAIKKQGLVSWSISRHVKSLINQLLAWQSAAQEREKSAPTIVGREELIAMLLNKIPQHEREKYGARLENILTLAEFTIRKSTLEQIAQIPTERLMHFFHDRNDQEAADRISEIITYGF